jgi:hypothetical protein
MEKRYDEPKEPPPDPALINSYLWLAFPNHRVVDLERAAAKAALVQLYREQREQVNHGHRSKIDPRLMAFVRDELRYCLEQPDPLGAVENFWTASEPRRRQRGRPATPHRDFVIAGDIAEKIESGCSIDLACRQLEQEGNTGLEFEQLRRIYFVQKKADDAGLRMDLQRRKAERNSLDRVRSHLVYLLKSKAY